MKNRIIAEQEIVYQTLENCLKGNKLSHALLFTGPKGTPKFQTALFLAQSLICKEADPFACEECELCDRVKQGQYTDVLILDGTQKSIKKDDVIRLQNQFNKTALEENGRKIYIINQAENATIEALNSLLKFLEEPSGENTTAILIVDQVERLLPTIVSRCQIIPFRPIPQDTCYSQAIEKGVDPQDAFLLSYSINDSDEILEISEKESYQKAIVGIKQHLNNIRRIDESLVNLQSEIFNEKDKTKETLIYFISIFECIIQNALSGNKSSVKWIQDEMDKLLAMKINLSQWLLILLETKDKCNRPFNTGLLLDQMILQMKEVMQ